MLAAPHPLTLAEQATRESAMHWFTLAIEPQSWRRIGERAQELGYETYCPMRRHQRGVERPLLGGYMFVDMPAERRRFSMFTPSSDLGERPGSMLDAVKGCVADPAKPSVDPIRGCRGFVGIGGIPTAVHEAVIARLREREADGEFDFAARAIGEDGYVVPSWYRLNLTVEFVDDSPWPRAIGKTSHMTAPGMCDVWLPLFKGMKLVPAMTDWIRPIVE
jgi:transcription antitermination factor NusG